MVMATLVSGLPASDYKLNEARDGSVGKVVRGMAHLCAGSRLSWSLAGVEEEEECESYAHHQHHRNTIPEQRVIQWHRVEILCPPPS